MSDSVQRSSARGFRRVIRRSPIVVAAVALAVVITGCQPVQRVSSTARNSDVLSAPIGDKTIVEGGNLVMALSAEPDRLDPTTSSSLYTRYVMQAMCQKLYDIDGTGNIVPQLATELPKVSSDGLSVTIALRSGVVFADGSPLTADAVRTTIERGLTLSGSARKSELGPITDVTAVDPTHLKIVFSTPFAPLAAALADRAGMILSPKALQEKGAAFGDSPVCVGPFKFTERIPQTSITVERDPLYYDAKNVHLDRITYRIITDGSIRAANLRSGDVQVADNISTQDMDSLSKTAGIGLLASDSVGYQALTLNLGNVSGVGTPIGTIDRPLATTAAIREALSMSIDREALVNSVFAGWFSPACSPISVQSPYTSALSGACPKFDPVAAKKLLTAAGVAVPFPISMKVSNSPDALRFAQALQAAVIAGGFALSIVPVEYSTLLSDQTRGDFEMIQLGWSGRVDPQGNMFNFLSTGGGNNYSGYSNRKLDTLLTRAAAATGMSTRTELYGEAVKIVQTDNPIIYLYRQRSLTGYSTKVAGISTFADGVVHLSTAAFVSTK